MVGMDHGSLPMVEMGEPDVAFGGPQGNIPQFVVECPYSHTSKADPIVAPGAADGGHQHVFFGSVSTDESSTATSLLAADTFCEQQLDRSAYWTPAMYDHDQMLIPDKVTIWLSAIPAASQVSRRTIANA